MIACSIFALIGAFVAHFARPSDTYEKDQPKTMSYTTDIIVHGRWILPTEMGGPNATKPPLYNWIAAPFVAALGFESETAHRAPSMLALFVTWCLLVFYGSRIDGTSGVVGWLAGLAFLINAAMFTLGFLARTDMLLTLWLILGWLLATDLMLRREAATSERRFALQLGFWLCVALAALTKGPPALVLVLYAIIAPRVVLGSWSASREFGWWWGIPIAVAPFSAWVGTAWMINPQHVIEQLWGEEVFGRVTGLGEEGNREGPVEFFYRLGHMPFYYVTRFAPWSILSILAMIELHQDRRRAKPLAQGPARAWLIGAVVMLVIIIGFFSLSTGKRAAYIASAYGPGAILAGWWIARVALARWPKSAAVVAAVFAALLAGLTFFGIHDSKAPAPGFGREIQRFLATSSRIIDRESVDPQRDPILIHEFDYLLLRAMMGGPFVEGAQDLRTHLDRGLPAWVFRPADGDAAGAFSRLREELTIDVEIEVVHESADLPRAVGWPGRVQLLRIMPH